MYTSKVTHQVFMEFFDYHTLEGEKFQLVYRAMGLSLAQGPTGICYYSICAILTGLVENSSQTRPRVISVELEGSHEICIDKNRHGGMQPLQVIEGLFAPAVPLDGSLFLASILTQS